MVRSEMDAERSRPDFGPEGAAFVECVTNPFGTDSAEAPPMARIPDGSSMPTCCIQETGTYSWSPGAITSAIIQLVGMPILNSTADQSLQILTGADAGDITATMTTLTAEVFGSQKVAIQALVSSGCYTRVVSAALRIAKNTDDTKQTALYRGYVTPAFGRSGAATFQSNAILLAGARNSGTPLSAREGIIVRRSCPAGFDSFHPPNQAIYTDFGGGHYFNSNGPMPMVVATGLQDTVYHINWRVVYEYQLTPDLTPLDLQQPSMEEELSHIAHLINQLPFITKADSFKSFMTRVWKAGKAAGKWAWDNKDTLVTVGSTLAKLAK